MARLENLKPNLEAQLADLLRPRDRALFSSCGGPKRSRSMTGHHAHVATCINRMVGCSSASQALATMDMKVPVVMAL